MAAKTQFFRRPSFYLGRREKLVLYIVVIVLSLWAMIAA